MPALPVKRNVTIGPGGFANTWTLTSTAGVLSLQSSSLTADPDASNNGGNITISGNSIVWSAQFAQPLTLTANAAPGSSGNGGDITLAYSGKNNISTGSKAGGFSLSANGGSVGSTGGDGGKISIFASKNLFIDTSAIQASPLGNSGAGGMIAFASGDTGTGTLLINGSIDVSGVAGSGGSISLTSSSTTPFIIGAGAKTNGVVGSLIAGNGGGTNGDITVTNKAGGITQTAAVGPFNELTFTAGGSGAINLSSNLGDSNSFTINLNTTSGAITSGASILQGQFVTLTSKSGIIGPVTVNTGDLAFSTTGNVTVSDTNAGLSLLSPSRGKVISVTSNGDLRTTGTISATSAVNLTSTTGVISLHSDVTAGKNGTVTLDAAGDIDDFDPAWRRLYKRKTINLTSTAGSIGTTSALRLNATTLNTSATAGNIQIINQTGTLVTLKSAATNGAFSLITGGGGITDLATLTTASTVALDSTGNMAINGNLGNVGITTQITIDEGGSGKITGSKTLSALDIVLDSITGLIGSGSGLLVNTVSLTVGSGGKAVVVKDMSAGPIVLHDSTSAGAFTLNTAAATTLTNIAAGAGNIKVVESSGQLNVATGATLSTTNGGITLENSNAKSGSIVIGDGATISSLALRKGGGQVVIAIGSASPAAVVGPPPANSTVTGTVFFGKQGIDSLGTTLNTFTGTNTKLIFSTGKLAPAAIQIGTVTGGVTIIADPPSTSAATGPLSNQSGSTLQSSGTNFISMPGVGALHLGLDNNIQAQYLNPKAPLVSAFNSPAAQSDNAVGSFPIANSPCLLQAYWRAVKFVTPTHALAEATASWTQRALASMKTWPAAVAEQILSAALWTAKG